MDYNDATTLHFDHPGDPAPPASAALTTTEVWRDRASGTAVQWLAWQAPVTRVSFRALGCPHVLAACARWCQILNAQMPVPDVAAMMRDLAVPAEKRGRILLVHDALGTLLQNLDADA
ncbi:MAG: hypothetical protein AAFX58_05740 [Pseudomonadota bacterium]